MSADPISAGLMVASSLLGGFEERRQLNAQAAVSDENGRLSELAGEQQIQQTRRDERALAGEAIAAMAESGFALGTGTALDLIQQSALQREIEIGNVRAQAQGEAYNHRMAAYDARKAGKAAMLKGFIGSGAAAADFASSTSANRRLGGVAESERKYRLRGSYGGTKPFGVMPSRLRVFGPPTD